jgi:2-iminobutanoate/2-iminopropanoate deaminase
MQKEVVSTELAPEAIGPYSQAVKAGNMLFVSGQIGIDPKVSVVVAGGIEEQTLQVMKNLGEVLKAAGMNYSNVVKTTCYLSDMESFKAFNAVYADFFSELAPARATVAVKTLPLNVLVEVDAIAVK